MQARTAFFVLGNSNSKFGVKKPLYFECYFSRYQTGDSTDPTAHVSWVPYSRIYIHIFTIMRHNKIVIKS